MSGNKYFLTHIQCFMDIYFIPKRNFYCFSFDLLLTRIYLLLV